MTPPIPPLDPNDPFNQLNTNSNPNLPRKRKNRLWLWITLGVVIPLFFCGLGIGGIAYFAITKTKPVYNEANNFYKALKNGDNIENFECAKTKRDFGEGELERFAEEANSRFGEVKSYDFKNYNNSNGQESVSGTVTRSHQKNNVTVIVDKDNGKYKICTVLET